MTSLGDTLPDDPATLKAMVLAERARADRLAQILKEMQRHRFGRRAETLPLDQLELSLEDIQQTEAAQAAQAEKADPERRKAVAAKRRANRGSLPAHLPRIETVVDIEDKTCPCCAGALHVIGEDRAERLDIVPAQFRVLVIRRPKYACRTCEEGVIQAPAPARLIEGGLSTEAMVAHVVTAKYADHLPLYRQAQIYARQGINLDRSTLADWTGRAAFLLRPVHEHLLKTLKVSAKLFADETTAPVLDPGRGRTKTGQLWAYARDDRPWGGSDPPAVAYVYAPDRKAERPMAHLAGFAGVLQVDGYGGYRALAEKGDVKLAFCWAHVRRRFYELAAAGPAPIAAEALERIKALYAIEADIRGEKPDVRCAARQERTRPLIEALEPWLRARLETISQKTKLAEAIRYALSRWAGLSLFLDDGRIEIDNNTVERSIRPLALTRKNALFAGSDGGGEHWAILASLIETAKLNGVDPQAYLTDVITRIVQGHPQSRIDDLLPLESRTRACHIGRMNAAADSPEQIATLRIELLDTDPLIWRQVEVPISISLKTLHNIIQAAMGWLDYHLWEMRLGKQTYGLPMDEDWGALSRIDGAKVRLSQILGPRKTVIDYTYDFGDSWDHRLTLTNVRRGEPNTAYPRYTDGERPAPPEDCGGVPGFYAALEARADPSHPDHADVVEWLADYNPEEFDDIQLKFAVGRIASRRRAAKGPKNKAAGQ